MGKFKDFGANYIQGRYGIDELYKFILKIFFIIWILNLFLRNPILYYLGLILLIWGIFRVFSKNYEKRHAENLKYIEIKNKFFQKYKLIKNKWKDRKTHIYRKCPNCKAEIRLPKKKGKHIVNCPKCKKDFDVKC
jgi:hypothetical protein